MKKRLNQVEKELYSTKKELERLKREFKAVSTLLPSLKKGVESSSTLLDDINHKINQNYIREHQLYTNFATKRDHAHMMDTIYQLKLQLHQKSSSHNNKTNLILKNLLQEIFTLKKEVFHLERENLLLTNKEPDLELPLPPPPPRKVQDFDHEFKKLLEEELS